MREREKGHAHQETGNRVESFPMFSAIWGLRSGLRRHGRWHFRLQMLVDVAPSGWFCVKT